GEIDPLQGVGQGGQPLQAPGTSPLRLLYVAEQAPGLVQQLEHEPRLRLPQVEMTHGQLPAEPLRQVRREPRLPGAVRAYHGDERRTGGEALGRNPQAETAAGPGGSNPQGTLQHPGHDGGPALVAAQSAHQRSLRPPDESPVEGIRDDPAMEVQDLLFRHGQVETLHGRRKVLWLHTGRQPASFAPDVRGRELRPTQRRIQALAEGRLEGDTQIEDDRLARRVGDSDSVEHPGVFEQPLLDRQVVVLDELLAEHQPIVHIQLRERPARGIEAEEAVASREGLGAGKGHPGETEFPGYGLEEVPVAGIDQQVEVCLSPQRVFEVLVALPMGVAHSPPVQLREEGGDAVEAYRGHRNRTRLTGGPARRRRSSETGWRPRRSISSTSRRVSASFVTSPRLSSSWREPVAGTSCIKTMAPG